MTRFVLDASMLLQWIWGEQVTPFSSRLRKRIEASEAMPLVPWLWHWEVANSVVYHERRKIIPAEATDAAWENVKLWSRRVETDLLPPVPPARSYQLARSYALTVYDAAYLELALRHGLPLATLDQPLRAAAAQVGVQVDF